MSTIVPAEDLLLTLNAVLNMVDPKERSLAAKLLYESKRTLEAQQYVINQLIRKTK